MSAALLALALAVAPQEGGSPLRLTLAEAVARARAASPAVQQADALQRAAAADVRLAGAARLPQAELQAGYSRLSDVPEVGIALPGGGLRTIFPNIPDNTRFRAAVSLPLFTGGRLSSLGRAARFEEEAAGLERGVAAADVALETAAAYWALVTARESQRVVAEALSAYDAHLADARNREQFGVAARNEVLAVQVERDRAEVAALRAANAAEVAQANLARLLGIEGGAAVEPTEPLPASAGEPVPAVDTLVAEALAARPERAALQARVQAGAQRVKAERGARWPQAALSAGWDHANPNRRILPPEARFQDSWDVNLAVSWNVFDGGRTAAAVSRAEARLEAARSQLLDLDRRLALQVRQRALELQAARAAAEVGERSLAAARESQRVAGERYRAGLLSSAELLDAEVALLRAALERTEARAQARLAEAALQRALGR